VQLVSIRENEKAEKIYKELQEAGIEVLYDDREDVSVGAKFADADLLGLPIRLVVSGKTRDEIEWKQREKTETELLSLEHIIRRLSKPALLGLT
jgi:prolyl-tRNA synthetase